MLKEIRKIRQEGPGRRRWFRDSYWDLYAWYDEANSLIRFELCYGKPRNEQVFAWRRSGSHDHWKVNETESTYTFNQVAIYDASDADFDPEPVIERFRKDMPAGEAELREFVLRALREARPAG